MSELISQAKEDFLRAKNRIIAAIESTPDEKLSWSPSSTARTPLQLVACAALGTEGMLKTFSGKPFPYANMQEMDRESRIKEKKFTTRKDVLSFLEETSSAFLSWLESLTDSQLGSMADMPMGKIPLAAAINFPGGHIHCRACQLDYIQTIYGDLDWHMESEKK